ncbi:MAG TPA: acyl-CoA dehydrogenase family protein [Phenylobacterium sp.]|nr:acyl-CoA dehydrogenase family protein [Phenylobacterium sp.]
MTTLVASAPARTFEPLARLDDLEAFRAEVRAWLEATVPADWRTRMAGASEEEYVAYQRWWLGEMRKVGLATPHWPRDWGGADLSLRHQTVIFEEIARIDAPNPDLFVISLYHLPATLFGHGSPEQRDRYLTGVKERGEVWCQGFSEPNAGSDLASLRTRAERKGDVYVVNGQKVWSSYGRYADYCLLLARTDPTAKKHAGISYFILDMTSPGVTVRPIRQPTGAAEFCEIFLDNVEIPVANRIGEENQGWLIAQSTLSAERGLIIFELAERMARAFEADLAEARAGRADWFRDDQFRREYMAAYGQMVGLRLMIRRMMGEMEVNAEIGASTMPSLIKIQFSELLRRYTDLQLRIGGLEAQKQRPNILGGGLQTGNRMYDFLMSYAWTIAGGANEIIKTVVAERMLGLPRG